MLTTLLLLTALFFVLGFVITERNAKYLLSGYNTMPEEQRKQLNLAAFIRFHKRFHVFLSLSFLLIGLTLYLLKVNLFLSLFIGGYPLFAYMFFLWKSMAFWRSCSPKSARVGIALLLIVTVGVLVLLLVGLKNDRLTIDADHLKISGMYSVNMPVEEIESVTLLDTLPEIRLKTNGFATGPIKKGYFILKNRGTAKLILNSPDGPFILITPKNDQPIYYSLNASENEAIYQKIQAAISE